ncbi:nucleoside-binding protein [Pseudoalteromonas tunicata]|nr:nucleoside-binding protein [Pseudoalteromonas tunicata]
MLKIKYFVILSLPLSCSVLSETLWSDFSATYLKGNNYEVGDNNRQVLTLEYASGTSWGDIFTFVDRLDSSNGDLETYLEFSPRFNLTQLSNDSLLKDVLLATTVEIGEASTNYLYGIGTNLSIPHFQFFQLNFYYRNNELQSNNWQLTPAWSVPFSLGNSQWRYNGFIDWVSSTDTSASGYNFTSQLAWNAGEYFQLKDALYLGVEYVYWHNKFGIAGIDERNANILVKWHF